MIEIFFLILSVITSVITYAWSEHGFISLISSNKPIFNKLFSLRGFMIYNRHIFESWFITTVVLITLIQLYFLFTKNKKPKIKIIIASILILSFSYPFLSTDIFSYMLSGKILYLHHLNPYTTIPESLRDKDIWLSFTYWTHRPYIYGPVALAISTIPFIALGANKFLTIFYLTKLINGLLFIATGIIISKLLSRKKATYLWFTNPLLLIELVINAHNETIMLFLFFLSALFWKNNKKTKSLIVLILSYLTKYTSLPFSPLIFIKEKLKIITARIMSITGVSIYLLKYNQLQLWYFTWLYLSIPFSRPKKKWLIMLFIIQTSIILDKYLKFVGSGNW